MHFADLTAWIQANPVLFSVVIWPFVSAFVLGIFKPRTPEQYAAMNPRVAGFLHFLSGSGLDPVRMLEGVKRTLTGSSLPIATVHAQNALERSPATTLPAPPANPDETIPPPDPPPS